MSPNLARRHLFQSDGQVADADADYKEASFKGAKLGLDLLAGPSTGHLPVLASPITADAPNANK